MRNKNFVRKKQAIYISPNKKSTRIIKTLMDFFFFIKIKIKMVCFSVPSLEIERTAQGRVETMLPHMMEVAGVTEELKACDPMRWMGLMNTLKAQAEEIILAELIND